MHCAIFPSSFSYKDKNDTSLGEVSSRMVLIMLSLSTFLFSLKGNVRRLSYTQYELLTCFLMRDIFLLVNQNYYKDLTCHVIVTQVHESIICWYRNG